MKNNWKRSYFVVTCELPSVMFCHCWRPVIDMRPWWSCIGWTALANTEGDILAFINLNHLWRRWKIPSSIRFWVYGAVTNWVLIKIVFLGQMYEDFRCFNTVVFVVSIVLVEYDGQTLSVTKMLGVRNWILVFNSWDRRTESEWVKVSGHVLILCTQRVHRCKLLYKEDDGWKIYWDGQTMTWEKTYEQNRTKQNSPTLNPNARYSIQNLLP